MHIRAFILIVFVAVIIVIVLNRLIEPPTSCIRIAESIDLAGDCRR